MKQVEYNLEVIQGKENFIGSILEHISRIAKTNIKSGNINALVSVVDEEETILMREVFSNLAYVKNVSLCLL